MNWFKIHNCWSVLALSSQELYGFVLQEVVTGLEVETGKHLCQSREAL